MKIVIPKPEKVKSIIAAIKHDGPSNLHFLIDFDRTLTHAKKGDEIIPSISTILRKDAYLSKAYVDASNALFDKYHPIEIDASLPRKELEKVMENWWREHNKLFMKHGLSLSDVKRLATTDKVVLRKGTKEFLELINKNDIPVVIVSAAACGDVLPLYFAHNKINFPNISYVSNFLSWNEQGKAIGTKGDIIHVFNKNEDTIKRFPEVYAKIKSRKNVILIGDSIGDAEMAKGFSSKNALKIGILNTEYQNNKEAYEKAFDIVLEGDGDFSYLNDFARELFF